MRSLVLLALVGCAHATPRVVEAPKSATEQMLVEVSASMKRVLPHSCADACCAHIRPELVVSYASPQRQVDHVELQSIALLSKDPVVVALALTWLSSANDPNDIPFLRNFLPRTEEMLWFEGVRSENVGYVSLGSSCPRIEWQVFTPLGVVALRAIQHIAGVELSHDGMTSWSSDHPDLKDTPEYWRAHSDQMSELWAHNHWLYLRVNAPTVDFPPVSPWLAFWLGTAMPPVFPSQRNLYAARLLELAPHAEAFCEVMDSDGLDAEKASVLRFAAVFEANLGLAKYGSRWLDQWWHAFAAKSETVVSLAILASRSGGRATPLERTLELPNRELDVSVLRHEILERWPAAVTPWLEAMDRGTQLKTLMNLRLVMTPTSLSTIRATTKSLVQRMSDRELYAQLVDWLTMVNSLDPMRWLAVDRDEVAVAVRAQRIPGFLAPVLVSAIDAIRLRVGTW